MPLIEWRDEFSVGVPAVDYEHRELIELINKLHDSLIQENPEITVEEFLGEIYARISAHFALEEHEMREQNYDEYLDHKADHERLLDEIEDIMDTYEDQRHYDERSFSERISKWFTEHFSTKDARLHKHLG